MTITPFRLLLDSTGLSLPEAARFLDYGESSCHNWSAGVRAPAPEGCMIELMDLMDRQGTAAHEALLAGKIEIGGDWPAWSAHDAALRRMVELASPDMRPFIFTEMRRNKNALV